MRHVENTSGPLFHLHKGGQCVCHAGVKTAVCRSDKLPGAGGGRVWAQGSKAEHKAACPYLCVGHGARLEPAVKHVLHALQHTLALCAHVVFDQGLTMFDRGFDRGLTMLNQDQPLLDSEINDTGPPRFRPSSGVRVQSWTPAFCRLSSGLSFKLDRSCLTTTVIV